MRGKLIVIEGTDCSGKETQTKLLMEHLRKKNILVNNFDFPHYNSPSGKIVGGPYLGKSYICEGWFPEGAPNVDPKVSSLYYAADRKYNIHKILYQLENGSNVILDRYVYSNMGHQGGKKKTAIERAELYKWIEDLEFGLLELPDADIKIFLHLPYTNSIKLRQGRSEIGDQNENDANHLMQAERAYIEIADRYGFKTIECADGDKIRTIEDISDELCSYIDEKISEQ